VFLFAVHGGPKAIDNAVPSAGVSGFVFEGRLPRAHLHLAEASKFLRETSTQWYCSFLRKSKGAPGQHSPAQRWTRWWVRIIMRPDSNRSDLLSPAASFRRFYQDLISAGLGGKILAANTSTSILRDAKAPWKEIVIQGRVEGDYLFRTAISKNVLPFGLLNPHGSCCPRG